MAQKLGVLPTFAQDWGLVLITSGSYNCLQLQGSDALRYVHAHGCTYIHAHVNAGRHAHTQLCWNPGTPSLTNDS